MTTETPGSSATAGGGRSTMPNDLMSSVVTVDIDELIESQRAERERAQAAQLAASVKASAREEEAPPALAPMKEEAAPDVAPEDDLDGPTVHMSNAFQTADKKPEGDALLGTRSASSRVSSRVPSRVSERSGNIPIANSSEGSKSNERRSLMAAASQPSASELGYQEEDDDDYDNVRDSTMDDSHVRLKKRLSLMERMQSKFLLPADETKERLLPQDTFSIMVIAETCSLPSIASVGIFILQLSIFILVILDLADAGGPGNVFDVPANVPPQLRATQFLAILVAVLTQGDLRTASILGRDGFTKDFDTAFMDTAPWKYWCSIVARSISGSVGLMVSFVLIITAPTVVELLLNFTAIEFVSSIDELCFYLSRQGFLGSHCKTYATTVANTSYKVSPESRMGFVRRSWKTLSLIIILVAFLAGWSIIVSNQVNGKYVCDTLFIQMGDDFVASLGTFNGLYDQDTEISLNGRRRYIERRSTQLADFPGRGIVEYCGDEEAWTFRWEPEEEFGKSDPCDGWVAKSSETKTYDVTKSLDGPWFARDATNREVVLDPFALACYDCDKANGGDFCGGKGKCHSGQCTCEEGWYGIQCEFPTPCSSLAVDARTEVFASTRDWSSDYSTIQLSDGSLVEAYHRPVYINRAGGSYDVVMFTGRRWALTSSEFLPRGGKISDDELVSLTEEDVNRNNKANIEPTGNDIGNFFHHIFHGYRGYNPEDYAVAFLSDFMDAKTDNDANSPVGFQWFRAVSEERTPATENQKTSQDIDTELLCQVCDENSNPCLYDGICVAGTCECSLDSEGKLCEIPPVQNGHCDPFFNTPEFKMDGGDCCESTCESTEAYVCGAEDKGYVNTGYFSCHQDPEEWQEDELAGQAGSFAGSSVDLSLRSIAVGELLRDRVRIYDKVGSSWVERDTITGDIDTRFGNRVALSAGQYNVVSNPSFLAPLTVAVQDGARVLRIYKCDLEGCAPFQEIPQVYIFDLSADGTVLSTTLLDQNFWPPTVIRVYEYVQNDAVPQGAFQVRSQFNVAVPGVVQAVWSMAQSGDGSSLVLQKQVVEIDPQLGSPISRGETFEVYAWNGTGYEVESQVQYQAGFNAYAYEFSLDMSQDGAVLAYGVAECLDRLLAVFDRGDNNDWVARTSAPIEETDCVNSIRPKRNNNLALSGDGSTVAFRQGDDAAVYSWNKTSKEWKNTGRDFPNTHYPVALSSDGTELAIGAPQDGIGGITGVYKLPARKTCPEGTRLLRISLTLDRVPNEHYWDLKNNNTGETIFEQGPYPMEYAFGTIVEETCVDVESSCFEFSVYSSRNRGLQAPGMYALLLEDPEGGTFEDVGRGSFTGLFASESFGNCSPCPDGMVPFKMLLFTCGPIDWELFQLLDITVNPPERLEISEGSTVGMAVDPTVHPNCGDQGGAICSHMEPLQQSFETCVDPKECYGVRVTSYNRAVSYMELELGDNKTITDENQICAGFYAAIGNPAKCPEVQV